MTDTATDAELVVRFRRGDHAAFSLMYRRHAAGLRAFVVRQVRDLAAAEDVVQDVFVLASQRIGQLSEPDRLRSWLYAIAARQTCSFLRGRRFEAPVDDTVVQLADAAAGPEDSVTAGERLAVLLAAAGGLAVEDQRVVRLFLSGLDGAALAEACDTNPSQVYVRLHRARKRLALSLGALLVARHGRRACPRLGALLEEWDGTLTPLLRKRIVRHVEDCADCERLRLRLVRPEALIGVLVLCSLPAAWRAEVVDELRLVSSARPAGGADGGPAGGGLPGGGSVGGRALRGSRPVQGAVATAAVVAVVVALGFWSGRGDARPGGGTAGVAAPPTATTGPGAGTPPAPAPDGVPSSPAARAVPGASTPPAPSARPGGPARATAAPGGGRRVTASPTGTAVTCRPVRAAAPGAGAAVADDFESGAPAGFTVAGDSRVVARVGPVRPPSCAGRMLLVGTGPGAVDLPAGDRPYVQASAVAAPVAVPPGATSLTARFAWNFLTSEYGRGEDRADGGGFRDQVSVRFIDATGGNVLELAGGVATSGGRLTRAGVTARDLPDVDGSVGQRGWQAVERTVPATALASAAYLQIVAWDVRDGRRTSAVLVDNLALTWN